MYIRLFHGRTSPDQTLEDWGTEGPIIGPLEIDWLYGTMRLHADRCTSFVELPENDGLIEFEGIYYGQFDIVTEEDAGIMQQTSERRPVVPLHEWEKAIEAKRSNRPEKIQWWDLERINLPKKYLWGTSFSTGQFTVRLMERCEWSGGGITYDMLIWGYEGTKITFSQTSIDQFKNNKSLRENAKDYAKVMAQAHINAVKK